jgi:hypothetical protein
MAAPLDSMPHGTVRTVALTAHPQTPTDAVHAIEARVHRSPDGTLAVTYTLRGDLDRVRIPERRPGRVTEHLWHHTCCELFVRRAGAPAYHELNFSPSHEWAAYGFDRYREGARLLDAALDPQVTVRRSSGTLELGAVVKLDRLSPIYAHAPLAISITAVAEDCDAVLSYWALAHPADRPDFHHGSAFVLELDEIRN